jgi:hypothetical protein
VDTGHLVYHNTDRAPTPTLTREEAMKKLLDYLGQSYMVVDGEIFDEAGVINRLADNLGTLVSNLDGTEEFALRILRAAKHPRFYFKGNALQRAKKYLARATSLINDFPWKYADDAPDEAVTDLRLAEALVQNAISALTGRGWERKIVPGAFNEDGALAAQKDEALRKPAPAIHVDVDTLKGRELSKKALEVAEQLEAMGDSPSTASVIGLNDPDLENPADTIPQAEYDALVRGVEQELDDSLDPEALAAEYAKLPADEQKKHYLAVKSVIAKRMEAEAAIENDGVPVKTSAE